MKAFPWSIDNGESVKGEKGMDLRDYFAAKAMSEMFDAGWIHAGEIEEVDLDHLAKWAYIMADAMMKERDRVKEQA
jgi:hypothetical protein